MAAPDPGCEPELPEDSVLSCGPAPDPSYTALAPKLSGEDENACVACGKAVGLLVKMEQQGACGLEKGSIYGAAVAVPQIARSVGWPGTLLGFTFRVFSFLVLNVTLQSYLLIMIGEEVHVFDKFSGKMHLCDFAASLASCPEGPNCRGPGGTAYTPSRLYSFATWSTRSFLRDSLEAAFPARAAEIHELADPGEYGMEDYYCRLVCCFIFMLSVVDDLQKSFSLLFLLVNVPSSDEKWIRYSVPSWAEKEYVKAVHGWSELDLVRFRVAGMPLAWKAVNLVCVCLPKLMLWAIVANTGFYFLMESAGIVEVVMNSMALTFVLSLDELIFKALMSVPVQHMVENLEDCPLYDMEREEGESHGSVLQRFLRDELGPGKWTAFCRVIVPRRLIVVLVLMFLFIGKYYAMNCYREADGSWVSKPMRLPETGTEFEPLAFIYPFMQEKLVEPYWTMPPES